MQISILTSTKICDLCLSWPPSNLRRSFLSLLFIHEQTQDTSTFSTCHTIQVHPRRQTEHRYSRGFGTQLLYQLVVTMRGSSLVSHQWLLYFPTYKVNIWKKPLALGADCSHSCHYGHQNSEILLCNEDILDRWILNCGLDFDIVWLLRKTQFSQIQVGQMKGLQLWTILLNNPCLVCS